MKIIIFSKGKRIYIFIKEKLYVRNANQKEQYLILIKDNV